MIAARRRGGGRFAGRSRGRTRFVGPFPVYSRRTRGGSRVTVTGCCLPIPLLLTLGGVLSARAWIKR
jgi:hypothetical protein